jgi:hypothetical protein
MTSFKKSKVQKSGMKAVVVIALLLGLGMASCKSETIDPKQKVSKNTGEKKFPTFADEHPPKEPNPGGG